MVQHLKEITLRARSKEKATSYGQMVVLTKEISSITIFAEKVYTAGQMVVCFKVLGKITRCTGLECLFGLMAVGIKVSTFKIKKKDKECFNGQTAGSIMEAGKTESRMASVLIMLLMELLVRANGKMESV